MRKVFHIGDEMIDLKNKVFLDSDGEMTFENKERLNFIMHFMKQGAVEQVATNKDGTFVREDAEISFNEIWLPCAELKAKQQATPEGSDLRFEQEDDAVWVFSGDSHQGTEISHLITSHIDDYNEDDVRLICHYAANEIDRLRAKLAKATPEGFVLVPVKEIKTWFLDESENIYREDPDWLCDIPIGEVVEVEHRVSYELEQDPVFAAIQWDEINEDVGNYETFDTKEEAEKVAAHCKAMIEAQEQSHDNSN